MTTPPPAVAVLLAAALGLACNKRQKESETPEPAPAPGPVSGATTGVGASVDDPVPRCGTIDSYRWIARDFRCADGSNPFLGDAGAAARARIGSTPSPVNTHFLDIYKVPCPEGEQTVYVDMYACPYEEAPDGQTTPALDDALALLEGGDFKGFIGACGEILQGEGGSADKTYCMIFTPVAFALSGDSASALDYTERLCDGLPPPSEQSGARADFLQMIFVAFTSALQVHRGALTQAEVDAFADASAAHCQVPRASLKPIDASGAPPEG